MNAILAYCHHQVADLGILSLSRGAPSLVHLDLADCSGVTDAGVAHLSSLVIGGAGGGGRAGRLESLRLDGLPELSDDGLDALCSSPLVVSAASPSAVPSASEAAAAAAVARARARAGAGGGVVAAGTATSAGAAWSGFPGPAPAPALPSPPPAPAPPSSFSCLRLLSVAGCARVTDEGLARVVASPLAASLTELDISGTSATERILVQIAAAVGGNPGAGGGGGGGWGWG